MVGGGGGGEERQGHTQTNGLWHARVVAVAVAASTFFRLFHIQMPMAMSKYILATHI